MLTHDEIVKAVRLIRYSSKAKRNGRKTLTIGALSRAAGISRETTYQVAKTGRMSPETALNLQHALYMSGIAAF